MAKNRIKGITIEIGGDTTDLQKSLKAVDSSLRNTQNSLKDVNKLLKLDPTNTELLKQKQDLLKQSIDDTKTRLQALKDAYKQLDGQGTDEAKQQQKLLAREIVETEQNLKSLKNEYKDFGSVAKQQLQEVGGKMKEVGGQISSTGKTLAITLTAPILAAVGTGVAYNAQLEQYRTMFTTLLGSAEEADKFISQLQEDAQKSPFDTDNLIKANQYLVAAKVNMGEAREMIINLGNAISATGGGNDELNRMAQNLQQVKNNGKASTADLKQFANAGIDVWGLLAEATGKEVSELKDMDITYDMLFDAFKLASSEGGRYYGAMEAQSQTLNGSLATTKESIRMLLGEITESAMPIIVQVLEKVREVIEWLSSLDEETKERILVIAGIVAAIGPLLIIIGSVISAIGSVITMVSLLMSPFGLVVAAIAAVTAAGIYMYQSWDEVKRHGEIMKETIVFTFNKIKTAISDKINAAKDAVKSAIDKIKSFFNFQWSLPKLKMPHISISGEFSLMPLRVPHFSVDWYSKAMKNGMILNSPTIFGAMDGKLLGAGEAGSETIIGTNSLMNMIAKASKGTTINMTINAKDQNVNQLADIVIEKIVRITQRERAVYQ